MRSLLVSDHGGSYTILVSKGESDNEGNVLLTPVDTHQDDTSHVLHWAQISHTGHEGGDHDDQIDTVCVIMTSVRGLRGKSERAKNGVEGASESNDLPHHSVSA